jgi:hypothetical protein
VNTFPSNSNEPRKLRAVEPEEKVVEKIITGKAIKRKPPLGHRIREMFVGKDDRSVIEYVIGDIMVPALKDLFVDSISQGMERMFYGEARARRTNSRPSSFGGSSQTPYHRYSSPTRRDDRPSPSRRSPYQFYEIILDDRAEAVKVINELRGSIERYDFVTIREFYELVGAQFHHTDDKFGWTNLDDAAVRRVSGGYLIDLPAPDPID